MRIGERLRSPSLIRIMGTGFWVVCEIAALLSVLFASPQWVFYFLMAAGWWGFGAALYAGPRNTKWAIAIGIIPSIFWIVWMIESR